MEITQVRYSCKETKQPRYFNKVLENSKPIILKATNLRARLNRFDDNKVDLEVEADSIFFDSITHYDSRLAKNYGDTLKSSLTKTDDCIYFRARINDFTQFYNQNHADLEKDEVFDPKSIVLCDVAVKLSSVSECKGMVYPQWTLMDLMLKDHIKIPRVKLLN